MAGVIISEPRSNQAILMLTVPPKAAPGTDPRVKSDAWGPAQPPAHTAAILFPGGEPARGRGQGEKQSGVKLHWTWFTVDFSAPGANKSSVLLK